MGYVWRGDSRAQVFTASERASRAERDSVLVLVLVSVLFVVFVVGGGILELGASNGRSGAARESGAGAGAGSCMLYI